jgi:hypothetical protein
MNRITLIGSTNWRKTKAGGKEEAIASSGAF